MAGSPGGAPVLVPLRRSGSEKQVAAYIVREHKRGRSLDDILDDPYVRNRCSDQEIARVLESPEVIRALGDDIVAEQIGRVKQSPKSYSSRPTPRSRARSTATAPITRSHAAIPFDLKTTMSSSDCRPWT